MKSGNQDKGWITGRIYFNRADKRIIVKRPNNESSYTMNLGNNWVILFYVAAIVIIVILSTAL